MVCESTKNIQQKNIHGKNVKNQEFLRWIYSKSKEKNLKDYKNKIKKGNSV